MHSTNPPSNYNAGWLFKESQRFTQWWMWLFILLGTAAFVYALVSTGIFEGHNRHEPGAETAAALGLVGLMIAVALLASMRLDVKLNESGVYFRFFPFHVKFQLREWKETEHVYLRKYKPLMEYGGWGIRTGFIRGKG